MLRATVSEPRIYASGKSDVGRHRKQNEDRFLVASLGKTIQVGATNLSEQPLDGESWTGDSHGTLLMVADGMGGHGAGDKASTAALKGTATYLINVVPKMYDSWARQAARATLPGFRDELSGAIAFGEASVGEEAAKPGAQRGMGTTLTLAFLSFPLAYVAHVGDSRAYLLRGGTLERLTVDHTIAEQIKAHGTDPGDASYLHDILWNAIGGTEGKAEPTIGRHRLEVGDVLLLCSDGLTKHVGDDDLTRMLQADETPAKICEALVQAANDGGGTDNVTAVVARVR